MTPHDLFRLERKLLDLADGGVVPHIVGVHSLAVEGSTASVIYDIFPDLDGSGLNFSFNIPLTIAQNREELRRFINWTTNTQGSTTLH